MAGGSAAISCTVTPTYKHAILARHIELLSKQNKSKHSKMFLLLPRFFIGGV